MATTRNPRRIGWVVAGSLAAGLVAAAVLAFAPSITVDEAVFTTMVLFGFALGWAMLAGLSSWWSDQPQRWALAPAVFMALAGGMVLLGPDAPVNRVAGWVWPPALLVLVGWMFTRAHRQLRSAVPGRGTLQRSQDQSPGQHG